MHWSVPLLVIRRMWFQAALYCPWLNTTWPFTLSNPRWTSTDGRSPYLLHHIPPRPTDQQTRPMKNALWCVENVPPCLVFRLKPVQESKLNGVEWATLAGLWLVWFGLLPVKHRSCLAGFGLFDWAASLLHTSFRLLHVPVSCGILCLILSDTHGRFCYITLAFIEFDSLGCA